MNQHFRVIEKHSIILRISHWLNIPLLFLMIWSGLLIYWAHQPYITIPENISNALGIDHRLAEGMGWHFLIMWPLMINGMIYFFYLLFSGEWRERFPNLLTWKEAPLVILHDLHLRKTAPKLRGKYNAAQKIAYTTTLFMGMGSVITGFAIYKPVQLGFVVKMLGGYKVARAEHFLLMLGFLLFFIIHIIQVCRAGWNNMRSMIAGFEIDKK